MKMPQNKSAPPPNRTGIVSLIKVLQHFGVKDLQAIYDKYQDTDEKLTWDKLIKIAKKHRIRAFLVQPNIEEFRELEYPLIAKMVDGAYIAIGSANDEVILAIDPRENRPKAIPIKEFKESWANELLIFSAAFSWDYIKKRYNIDWFMKVILHYKKPLIEVLIAMLFLQFMGIGFPLITQVIIDKVIVNNGISTLTVIGCCMVVFFFMQSLLTALKTYIMNHTTNKLDAILGTRLFRHLISLPLPYHEQRRVGETLMRVAALNQIREFFTGTGLSSILNIFFATVFVGFMFWYSVPLTLIALISVPLYAMQILAMPILKGKVEGVWRLGALNSAFMVESISNVETIKALAVEPQFVNKWENLIARYIRNTFEMMKFRLALNGFTSLVETSITMAILWYGGHMVMNGEFTLGQLIAFQMISRQALGPLKSLAMLC